MSERRDVRVQAPTARAVVHPGLYFDPARPHADPHELEMEARRNPKAVDHECPVCYVHFTSEAAFWGHARGCLQKWWSTLDVSHRVFRGATPHE